MRGGEDLLAERRHRAERAGLEVHQRATPRRAARRRRSLAVVHAARSERCEQRLRLRSRRRAVDHRARVEVGVVDVRRPGDVTDALEDGAEAGGDAERRVLFGRSRLDALSRAAASPRQRRSAPTPRSSSDRRRRARVFRWPLSPRAARRRAQQPRQLRGRALDLRAAPSAAPSANAASAAARRRRSPARRRRPRARRSRWLWAQLAGRGAATPRSRRPRSSSPPRRRRSARCAPIDVSRAASSSASPSPPSVDQRVCSLSARSTTRCPWCSMSWFARPARLLSDAMATFTAGLASARERLDAVEHLPTSGRVRRVVAIRPRRCPRASSRKPMSSVWSACPAPVSTHAAQVAGAARTLRRLETSRRADQDARPAGQRPPLAQDRCAARDRGMAAARRAARGHRRRSTSAATSPSSRVGTMTSASAAFPSGVKLGSMGAARRRRPDRRRARLPSGLASWTRKVAALDLGLEHGARTSVSSKPRASRRTQDGGDDRASDASRSSGLTASNIIQRRRSAVWVRPGVACVGGEQVEAAREGAEGEW